MRQKIQLTLVSCVTVAVLEGLNTTQPTDRLANNTSTVRARSTTTTPFDSNAAVYVGIGSTVGIVIIVLVGVMVWGVYRKNKARRRIHPNPSSENSYPYYLEQRGWQQFRQPLGSAIAERTERSSGSTR